jgi:peptide-methionine (S)-S-oxide reductase
MQLNFSQLFNLSVISFTGIISLASCAERNTQTTNMSEAKISASPTDTASFGTGCFWCTGSHFSKIEWCCKSNKWL